MTGSETRSAILLISIFTIVVCIVALLYGSNKAFYCGLFTAALAIVVNKFLVVD